MFDFLIRKDVRKILKRKDSDAGEKGKGLFIQLLLLIQCDVITSFMLLPSIFLIGSVFYGFTFHFWSFGHLGVLITSSIYLQCISCFFFSHVMRGFLLPFLWVAKIHLGGYQFGMILEFIIFFSWYCSMPLNDFNSYSIIFWSICGLPFWKSLV